MCTGKTDNWQEVHWQNGQLAECALAMSPDGQKCTGNAIGWQEVHWRCRRASRETELLAESPSQLDVRRLRLGRRALSFGGGCAGAVSGSV